MKSKLLILGSLSILLLFQPELLSSATITTLNFSELPPTSIPASGLHAFGIDFSFTKDGQVPSGTVSGATFGAPFDGATSKLNSPVLLGSVPGVLTLTFDSPTSQLSFDAALGVTTQDVFQVRLFNAAGFSLGTSNNLTKPAACPPAPAVCSNASEGSYSYSGASVKTAALDFSSQVPGATPAPFALDNLSYAIGSASPVPEPNGTFLLLGGLGLLMAVVRRGRGRRASC